nr:translation initiation factor IF-2-like [Aegilops tauschii subsp. strangulata]
MRSKAVPSGRIRRRSAATARSKDQSFHRSRMTGNESRDDAFKKGTIFAAAGPSEDRAGFHLGQQSPPPNATPRQPRRPHDHGDWAAPRHELCPRASRNHHHQGRHPIIQDLDTTSPVTRRTPTKETSGKVSPFAPLDDPQRRDPIGRPELASTDPSCCPKRKMSSVLQQREGDEPAPPSPTAAATAEVATGSPRRHEPDLAAQETPPSRAHARHPPSRSPRGEEGTTGRRPSPPRRHGARPQRHDPARGAGPRQHRPSGETKGPCRRRQQQGFARPRP